MRKLLTVDSLREDMIEGVAQTLPFMAEVSHKQIDNELVSYDIKILYGSLLCKNFAITLLP